MCAVLCEFFAVLTVVGSAEYRDIIGAAGSLQASKTSWPTKGNQSCSRLGSVTHCCIEQFCLPVSGAVVTIVKSCGATRHC